MEICHQRSGWLGPKTIYIQHTYVFVSSYPKKYYFFRIFICISQLSVNSGKIIKFTNLWIRFSNSFVKSLHFKKFYSHSCKISCFILNWCKKRHSIVHILDCDSKIWFVYFFFSLVSLRESWKVKTYCKSNFVTSQ